jgi:hypothetical protein
MMLLVVLQAAYPADQVSASTNQLVSVVPACPAFKSSINAAANNATLDSHVLRVLLLTSQDHQQHSRALAAPPGTSAAAAAAAAAAPVTCQRYEPGVGS